MFYAPTLQDLRCHLHSVTAPICATGSTSAAPSPSSPPLQSQTAVPLRPQVLQLHHEIGNAFRRLKGFRRIPHTMTGSPDTSWHKSTSPRYRLVDFTSLGPMTSKPLDRLLRKKTPGLRLNDCTEGGRHQWRFPINRFPYPAAICRKSDEPAWPASTYS